MLQIQSNTKAEGTKSRSKTYTPFPRFSYTRNGTTWTWTSTELNQTCKAQNLHNEGSLGV